MTALRDRILATIAEAEHRLALAEAAAQELWGAAYRSVLGPASLAHIAANDPITVAAEQRRIIASAHADLALLDFMNSDEAGYSTLWDAALDALNARYPETEDHA